MFVDKVRITVIGGRGGDGAVAFHREKYIASGGPDGGDGGHGGSVILRVSDHMSTLLDFRYKRKYQAAPGVNGMGRKMSGKRGENLIIEVPRGTVIRDAETNQIIVDMSTGEDYIIAKGGRGGWGNAHYATPTRQVPRFAKAGLKGQERDIIMELKLLADVGLVGFPNVGKSTLLSVTSNARPKIANYHFTTLFPNLGVIYVDEGVSFVMADIPASSRVLPKAPDWAMISCAISTAADCWSTWWMYPAARAVTLWRTSTPSARSCITIPSIWVTVP